MRRLIAAAAVAAALVGCGSAPARHGITIKVDRSPFRLTVLWDGKTVVAENADGRLRYQLRSGAQHELTKLISSRGSVYRVATDEPGRTATVTVAQAPHGYRIGVRLHPAANVQEIYDAFDAQPDEHFLGGGENIGSVDLRGQIRTIEVSCGSYAPIPFFASSAGWGLRLATENEAGLAFPDSPGGGGCGSVSGPQCTFPPLADRTDVCVQGARLEEDLYVGSLPQVLADYEADAGPPAVPPPSELELIKWRDVVSGPAEVLDDITRLQAAKIPIGWVLLDNPWETGGCNGLLTFDPTRIPDPAALVREVHEHGVKLMLWVSPKATCAQGYPSSGIIGPPTDRILDLRNPQVVAELQKRLRRLFALGVDGIKGDRGDEVDLPGALDNEYPLLYARAVIGAMPKGDAAIFRAATVGSQAVLPGIWAGDQQGLYMGLQQAVIAAQTAAMSGFPTWGSDVGGYTSLLPTPVTADVFERWAQLGAVSPVLEVGGAGPNATPWTLGAEAMSSLRSAAVLHYELFPYLYGLLERRQPVLRPLAFGFPDDAHSWTSPGELLVGPDLLAAPVTGPGVTPSVYVPPGAWVDLYTGATVQGGGPTFTRPTPMDQFPLYARQGSVVPFDLRTEVGSWWGSNELSHPGRAGFLATDGAELTLVAQPHDVQLFVPAPARPRRVTIAGRQVAWSWNAGPLPGVVIRLHGPTVRGRVVLVG